MQIITLIYSIILLFFYHPLYQNYTSLMNTSFSFFYYIWCVLLTLSLCLTFFKVTSLKKFIIFLSLFFFIGLILPYHKNYPIFSTLHVFIPLSCIIIALLFLAYLIKNKQKSEPILAHKIYLWFSYGLSIIAMFIIFFSQINGLIEISVLLFINLCASTFIRYSYCIPCLKFDESYPKLSKIVYPNSKAAAGPLPVII